jgi:glycosyltransferase involved in cell wall biosynthesis
MQLSVIICTHNPRPDYLRQTLDALRTQTLPKELWELLLIDNASKDPLADKWDLSWHPNARCLHESRIGKTHAMLVGIAESIGENIVVVDDDNILGPDYLSKAAHLTLSHTWVGAFGGNIIGEFEVEPATWVKKWLPMIAVVNVEHEEWTLGFGTKALYSTPCGAGMVIRRNIANYYAEMTYKDPLRRDLDRKGASLVSGGDTDMALCACALGFAVGRFPQLQMKHLIPEGRLKLDYLLRMAEGQSFSGAILQFIWEGKSPNLGKLCRSERLYRAYRSFRHRLRNRNQPDTADEFRSAFDRGLLAAAQFLESYRSDPSNSSICFPI